MIDGLMIDGMLIDGLVIDGLMTDADAAPMCAARCATAAHGGAGGGPTERSSCWIGHDGLLIARHRAAQPPRPTAAA